MSDLIERLRDSDHKRFPYFDALMTEAAAALTAERAALEQERLVSDKLEKALTGVRATLWVANEIPNGPINDTIWHTKHETLFDFMDAAFVEVAAIRSKGEQA